MWTKFGLMCLFIICTSANTIGKPQHLRYDGNIHIKKIDHDPFLGEDEPTTFKELTQDERIRRLGIIYNKIDANNDQAIDLLELEEWINATHKQFNEAETERQWKQRNPSNLSTLDWDIYKYEAFSFDVVDPKNLANPSENLLPYVKIYKREHRRWLAADTNQDGKLTKEEFRNFVHPDESPQMSDIVAMETLEDIDKDGDGKLSLSEYIDELYQKEGNEEEPLWVQMERETFQKFRDKDNDGFLNLEEVKGWVVPAVFNQAEAEARHLIYEADRDGDEKLSKNEVLDKHALFVDSQATGFGEILTRHDEF